MSATTTKKKYKFPTWKKVERAAERDDMTGFCLGCGRTHDCCEPDARRYTCQHCEQNLVFGAMECIACGYYTEGKRK